MWHRNWNRSRLNLHSMIKSYLLIGLRNLLRNKVFSFINIFGLSIGMTACVLIMLYVADERAYDQHHRDGDRIYRIASEVKGEKFVAAAAPIAEGLKRDFPEIEQSTRLLRFPGIDKMLLRDESTQKQFFEANGFYADSTFFQLFTYDLKFGDPNTALNGPNTIVISETVAEKFFGQENPIDKPIRVTLPFGDFHYTVKGVFRTGYKSHIPANLLLSMNNDDIGGWVRNQTNWATNNIFHTYVKLRPGADPAVFEGKLAAFLDRNGGADMKAAGFSKSLFIQHMPDIYLHSDYGFEVAPNGNINYLYVFSSIALFLLLMACINFMNLSTARSERRAKEVGLRKVIGAVKSSLVGQFLVESLLMSVLALVLAIVFIEMSIPVFNQLTHKQLNLMQLPGVYAWLALLTVSTGLVSGLYPAFYLSSFRPAAILKGKLFNTISAVVLRKGLVVFQFAISVVLILVAALISSQMTFLNTQNLGFDRDQKIVLPLQTTEAGEHADALRDALKQDAQVTATTVASTYPGIENIQDALFYAEGKTIQDAVDIMSAHVSDGYLETLGIELKAGRSFSREFLYDSSAVVLNEAAVRALGYNEQTVVGQNIYLDWRGATIAMPVVGVVKDYHFQGLQQFVKPLLLTKAPFFSSPNNYLIASVRTNHYDQFIANTEKTWQKLNPNSPFAYSFLDQDFQKNYEKESRTLELVKYFTLIAVIIACLGLFGLASFTAEQRVKEIGIRKVLGASVTGVVALVSKDFLKLVLIAMVIASPLAWYLMERWLQGFAYHVAISGWVFLWVSLLVMGIAFLTVSFQAVKSAIADPVDSLRTE